MKKASVTHEALESSAPIAPSVLVGIDWADKEHAFAIRTPDGKLHIGSFKHSPAAIREWIRTFISRVWGEFSTILEGVQFGILTVDY